MRGEGGKERGRRRGAKERERREEGGEGKEGREEREGRRVKENREGEEGNGSDRTRIGIRSRGREEREVEDLRYWTERAWACLSVYLSICACCRSPLSHL